MLRPVQIYKYKRCRVSVSIEQLCFVQGFSQVFTAILSMGNSIEIHTHEVGLFGFSKIFFENNSFVKCWKIEGCSLLQQNCKKTNEIFIELSIGFVNWNLKIKIFFLYTIVLTSNFSFIFRTELEAHFHHYYDIINQFVNLVKKPEKFEQMMTILPCIK